MELGSANTVSVNEDDLAINAFAIMNEKKLSALPILSDEGEVLSVVSSRDIKLLVMQSERSLEILSQPVMDFIKINRQQTSSAKVLFFFGFALAWRTG